MTARATIIIIAAVLAGAARAGDSPIQPAFRGNTDIHYPATPHRDAFRLRMRSEPAAAKVWNDDGYSLEVWNDFEPPELLSSMLFESSYGEYRLWLSDLTGDGIEEFILLTGRGRGTSATRETLTVYSREGSGFTALTSVPFSDYFGMGARWYYEPRFVRDGDRTVNELRLDWDDYSDGRLASPELIPEEKLIVIDLQ